MISCKAIASTARYFPSASSNSVRLPLSISLAVNPNPPNIFHNPLAVKGRKIVSATLDSESSGGKGEDGADCPRAVELVLKLYSTIKSKNVRELKEIIHDECRCICNFITFRQPLYGKEQVLDFFVSLIRFLGNHIEFRVDSTLQEGMSVGVHWRLEWNKSHFQLGKGFSFHICQMCRGKLVIRNVEMFIEPLLHIEPLRLNIIEYVTIMVDKMSSFLTLMPRTRALAARAAILLLLTVTAMFLCIKIW